MKSKSKINWETIFASNLFLFFALLALIAITLSVVNASYKRYLLKKELDDLKLNSANLNKENADLSKLIDYYNTKEFLEKEARRKLNFKKEGEEVIIVP